MKAFRHVIREVESTIIDLVDAMVQNNDVNIISHKNELCRLMSAHLPFAAFSRNYLSKRIKIINEVTLPGLGDKHGRTFEKIDLDFPVCYETVT